MQVRASSTDTAGTPSEPRQVSGLAGLCSDVIGWLSILLVISIVVWPGHAHSDSGPVAPCERDGPAPYPAFAELPNARAWSTADIASDSRPGICIAWASRRFTVLAALAGEFRFDGGVDDLLARFGAQSAWRGIKYWSAADSRWGILITDAAALDSVNHQRRRADFTPAELKSGGDHYFLQTDNRSSGAIIYRMKVMAIEADRLVVSIENVSDVSLFVFTLFDPGDLQSTYIFVKLAPGKWGYYNLSGAREGAAVIGDHEASYLNRAMAIYRHLIGVPGGQ